jgi:hypothetical protein
MPDQQPTTIVRKRQQITKANRTMFVWVAVASVVVGVAVVAAIFMAQKALFNERVLLEKTKTSSTLTKNLSVVDELKNQVRLMNTNQALHDSTAPGETQPIQVVLDALPSDANSSALGASLQQKLVNDPALRIEALRVDPVVGVESDSSVAGAATSSAVKSTSSSAVSNKVIHFTLTVSAASGDVNALRNMLQRFEHSIRAIDVSKLTIEGQGTRVAMTVDANAFYEPAKTVELKTKVVKP